MNLYDTSFKVMIKTTMIIINDNVFVISGAEIYARGLLFGITNLDMCTYNFMIIHKGMSRKTIDSATNNLKSKGLLDPQYK